jgi:1-acyl-sn-glycerol-3-phosphate acyltransferase
MLRSIVVFLLLLGVRATARLFCRLREDWMPAKPREMADGTRVVAILNHTSLYEPLIAGYASTKLLWRFARHGVLPVAEKTMKRPVGLFFRFLVRHTVTVTRQRDSTWEEVLDKIDDRALVVILPEGRMKRRNGLDSKGRPMTVRTGIAEILEALPDGRMLTVYSGGLHHIQAPGELLPRPLKTILCRFEMIDIVEFKTRVAADYPDLPFYRAVVAELTARRDLYCPTELQPPPSGSAS